MRWGQVSHKGSRSNFLPNFYFSDTPFEQLACAAMERRRQAYRPGTIKNYQSSQKLFIQFCLVFGVDVQYPTEVDFVAYAEWLVGSALSCSTIRNHFAAIRLLFLWWGKTDVADSLNTHAWSLTIKGLITRYH